MCSLAVVISSAKLILKTGRGSFCCYENPYQTSINTASSVGCYVGGQLRPDGGMKARVKFGAHLLRTFDSALKGKRRGRDQISNHADSERRLVWDSFRPVGCGLNHFRILGVHSGRRLPRLDYKACLIRNGGARSLALTLLRLNSLLTGKNTRSLRNSGIGNRASSL